MPRACPTRGERLAPDRPGPRRQGRGGVRRGGLEYADQFLDELDRKPFDRWLLERIAQLSDGGPVADVGCGPGQIAGHLAMAGADVTGFDLSPAMVDEACRRFPGPRVRGRRPHALPRGGWAAITSWYSLVHHAPQSSRPRSPPWAGAAPGGGWPRGCTRATGAATSTSGSATPSTSTSRSTRPKRCSRPSDAAGLEDVEWYLRGPTAPRPPTASTSSHAGATDLLRIGAFAPTAVLAAMFDDAAQEVRAS